MWDKAISAQAIPWNLSMVQEAAQPSIQGLSGRCNRTGVLRPVHGAVRAWLVAFDRGIEPAIILLGGMAALLWGLAAFGVMSLTSFSPATTLLLVHLSLMFWGALVRHVIEQVKLPKPVWLVLVGYCLAWLVLGLGPSARHVMLADGTALFRTFVSCVLGVAFFVLGGTCLKLRAAWLVWLGGISYSLYLFHPVASTACSGWFRQPTSNGSKAGQPAVTC